MIDIKRLAELARAAGFQTMGETNGLTPKSAVDEVAYVEEYPCGELLAKFAQLAAEDCARVCREEADEFDRAGGYQRNPHEMVPQDGCDSCEAAIRARYGLEATPGAQLDDGGRRYAD